MGMGWGGVGWGCSRSCTCSVHIKLLQPQNLWGWDGVGWCGDVHVQLHVAFTSSCSHVDMQGGGTVSMPTTSAWQTLQDIEVKAQARTAERKRKRSEHQKGISNLLLSPDGQKWGEKIRANLMKREKHQMSKQKRNKKYAISYSGALGFDSFTVPTQTS